jgi:hypothetical protein
LVTLTEVEIAFGISMIHVIHNRKILCSEFIPRFRTLITTRLNIDQIVKKFN